ncbi:UDP-N-acetylmuramoyl-tripeptide--D-alanyl-D-alanine ligase [Hungatella hathewayi]
MPLKKIASIRRAKVKKELYKKAQRDMKKDRCHFLSIRECCDILDVDPVSVKLINKKNLDEIFTSICAWDYYLIPGSLYAALPLYAKLSPDEAMKRGAKALLTDRQESDYPCIIVSDVMEAYCRLCGYIESRTDSKTIAITGSVGKTTTKDMVKMVCTQQYKTFCDVENNNMATLVGYLVQHIPADCEYYVQEVHEGDPDSARSISQIIHPNVAVITNIGESHLGNFSSYEGLIKGVTDITYGMAKDGVVIIDGDDVSSVSAHWDRKVIKVSVTDPSADYFATDIKIGKDGLTFNIVFGTHNVAAKLHMYGVHNVTDVLLAFAAGVESGVSPEKAVQGIKSYIPRGMRQNVVHVGKRTLYIDCFNAAVKSMKTALYTLCELPLKADAKRIAVLGDMAELGKDSESMHREVGRIVADSFIDVLICYGKFSAGMADEARKSSSLQVFHTENMAELNKLVKEHVGPKDVVLFKASHTTNLIATVRANFPFTYFRAIYMERLHRHFVRTSCLK